MNRLFEIQSILLSSNHVEESKRAGETEGDHDIQKDSELVQAIPSHEKAIAAVINCSEHVEREAELYCETCDELICVNCITRGGKHLTHDHELLEEAFDKYKANINPLLHTLEQHLVKADAALDRLDTGCTEIENLQGNIATDIHNAIRRFHDILDTREAALIGSLDRIAQGKLKRLAVQKDRIETTTTQLVSCAEYVKDSLDASGKWEVLQKKKAVTTRAETLCADFEGQVHMLEPETKADMVFLGTADTCAVIQGFGHVFTPLSPDPSRCHIPGEISETVVLGGASMVCMQALNYRDEACDEVVESLDCCLISGVTSDRVNCKVERKGESQYQITYQPTVKGRHQLHVKIGDQHISGSPFRLAVKSHPGEKLGTQILSIRQVNRPWGVATSPRGDVVVTSLWGHRVYIFSSDGELIRSFGTRGEGLGQFQSPQGVALDNKGNILVVDSNNHRIQKFSPNGCFLHAVGLAYQGDPLQYRPKGAAFNLVNGKIYVVDWNHGIEVLNSDLTFFTTFGAKGKAPGLFRNPIGIACDNVGQVYVADSGNNRIQVFTATGKLVRMFGKCGEGEEGLDRPVGVAVDANGVVYVSEGYKSRICTFSPDGQFVEAFGSLGEGPGQFVGPTGLSVDSSGVLYVCDQVNNAVKVF
jgi:DNA-binding beta-propeller fold protein YncE